MFWVVVLIALVVSLAVVVAIAWRVLHRRPVFKLTLREEGGKGLDFVIRARTATIGSEEGQTVVVSHPKVSRQHAVVEMKDGGMFTIRDLSRYGIRVNGEPAKEQELHSGDLIRLGDSIDLIFTRL